MTLASSFLLAAVFTRAIQSVDTIDPAMAQSTYDSHAISLVYETPLEIDYAQRPYRIKPGASELLGISDDALEYRFRMVDGTPLTSHDVKRAIEKLRDPSNPSPSSWTMKRVKEVKILDDRNFTIALTEKQHVFPWMLAMAHCGVADKSGNGTGPYKLKSWWRNHEMVFEKNPSWRGWREAEKCELEPFDEIRYVVVSDVTTQWLMFLKGEVDFLSEIARDNWSSVMDANGELLPEVRKRGVVLHGGDPCIEIRYLGMNMNDSVVGKNKKLRQALSCAFDFPTWKRFYNNSVEFAPGPVPSTVEGFLDKPFEYAYDLEKARRLIAEAGYPDGIDPKTGKRLEISLTIGRPTQDSREAGELLASFYERIGVKLNLKFLTWHAFLSEVNKGNVQLYMLAWVADYPDPENFLQLFYSKNKSPGPNHSMYDNPEYDAEYDKAMAASTKEARIFHWHRCQEILREDCPWIYTHITRNFTLVSPRVKNYIPGDFPYGYEKYYRIRKQ